MEIINNMHFERVAKHLDLAALRQQKYTRRNLLKRAAWAGAAGIGLLSLAACGSSEAAKPAEQAKQQVNSGAQLACAGSADIAATDEGARKALKYVEQSPDPARVCNNCRFFKQPEGGSACGGCQIVTGPIAPTGYCSTWTARS